MSYSSEHIQIMDMRFSAHVTVAEFEQWLSQVERFFLKKQHFVLVMQTDIGTQFPEEYRQLARRFGTKNTNNFFFNTAWVWFELHKTQPTNND